MSNYGYKRTVVGAHYGLRDWLSQRVTAAIMILFTLLIMAVPQIVTWLPANM